ncbi:holo-ACP synthase [Halothiobacillus sp. DCM-1]|uniref:holo-ACP synthase n=1 Tax=Halothiobacillus sp. DCM-1 TaxID=3112558 RepID=UPI00325109CB
MIVGLGTDLVEIARIERAWRRHGDRLLDRLLGDDERAALPDSHTPGFPAWLAKRFAAKEAAAKALGTGFRAGITLADIQTVHTPLGAPQLKFTGAALRRAQAMGVTAAHVSVSDERHYALAFVVLESVV